MNEILENLNRIEMVGKKESSIDTNQKMLHVMKFEVDNINASKTEESNAPKKKIEINMAKVNVDLDSILEGDSEPSVIPSRKAADALTRPSPVYGAHLSLQTNLHQFGQNLSA